MDTINTEDFIAEIENHPAIWDSSSDEYGNKIIKKNNWEEIITKYILEFGEKTKEEKQTIGLNIQRKWKSLRDSFTRELAKQKEEKSGTGAKRRQKYLYFEQLSFLQRASKHTSCSMEPSQDNEGVAEETENNEGQENMDRIDAVQGRREAEVLNAKPSTSKRSGNRKRPIHEEEDQLIKYLANKIVKNNTDTDDEDKMFLLLLVSELKKVPEHLKLEVKRDLLNVFREAKARYSNPTGPSRNSKENRTQPPTYQNLLPYNYPPVLYPSSQNHQSQNWLLQPSDVQRTIGQHNTPSHCSTPSPSYSQLSSVSQESLVDFLNE